ncbi:FliI/YscN family ATPase [Treponema zuelzerae]|uniref:FliI/YscN family ATPase n=1 Tax=Teretinema zuelzerae TaxID=156 RepID=A0AAE3EF53_9SPIR|nr:FliI/YscN family ATPase [Teretinema zuelzerae]MCD1653237.1 FliI/YscN family ATPase [Teretinema zuelzerae]
MIDLFNKYVEAVEEADPIKYTGSIIRVKGMLLESRGPQAVIGEVCLIHLSRGNDPVFAEVVGLDGTTVQLMSYDDIQGIEVGCKVTASGSVLTVPVGNMLLGRVLNAMGKAADQGDEIVSSLRYPVIASPPDPMKRRPISDRIVTGVRAIDGLLAVGRGQRLGIFAGSGVGKSTLLGMISRNTNADINVIALIGERGREVVDFIENDLGPEGLKRSVVVMATSDQSPVARIRGAYVATAIAEYFRDQGKDVMLMFDSVTRFAKAQREIGLAIGEPPATRGYTPSVFETLPRLLERSGTSDKGSITGFYTVLVDGDDMDEPISDTVRGILDGHIILSRKLAQKYHYPAIDVLASISRLANRVSGPVTRKAVGYIRRMMAIYAESEDMINVGAYQKGSNPSIDEAISNHSNIEGFLTQEVSDPAPILDTLNRLGAVSSMQIPDDEKTLHGPGASQKYVQSSESAQAYDQSDWED